MKLFTDHHIEISQPNQGDRNSLRIVKKKRSQGGGRSAKNFDVCGSIGDSVSTYKKTRHISSTNIGRSVLREIIGISRENQTVRNGRNAMLFSNDKWPKEGCHLYLKIRSMLSRPFTYARIWM
jgi:hypothetical protein